jgi:hypothetical protein
MEQWHDIRGEFLDQLSDYHHIKEGFIPWIQLGIIYGTNPVLKLRKFDLD